MIVLLRALVLRWMARHRLRTALATLAVALGVAAYLSSAAVGGAIERTAGAALRGLAGDVVLSVEPAGAPLPVQLAESLTTVPGVAAVAPVVTGWREVDGLTDGRAFVVGVDPAAELRLRRDGGDGPVPELAPELALPFLAGRAAIVGRPLADELDLTAGDALRLLGAAGWTELSVAAVVDPGRSGAGTGGRLLVLSRVGAAGLLGRTRTLDRIDLGLAPDASVEDVADRVRARLEATGGGTPYVGPPRASDTTSVDVLAAVQVGLRIGALVALLIGMFLIHHTLAVGVAERRREIGILRAVGATRAGLGAVFALEATVLGVVGSILGVGFAYVLAAGALQGFTDAVAGVYFADESPPPELSTLRVASGLLVGVGTSVVAALVPATRAAREAPSDAIRRGPEESTGRSPGLRAWLAPTALVVVAAGVTHVPGLRGDLAAYAAALLLIVAFLLVVTPLVTVCGRLAAPLLARLGGIPGRLAADDLARHPRRAALPAAALAFGLALVVETGGVVHSLSAETVEWMEEQVAGDLFVSSGSRVMGVGNNTPMEADALDGIDDVPGVAHSVPVRFQLLPYEGTRVFVMGLGMDGYRPMARLRVEGGPRDELLDRLAAGDACLVSENFRDLHGRDLGDRVTLDGPDTEFELEIVGTFRDYSWPRGSLMVDLSVFRRHLSDDLLDQVSLRYAPGADPRAVMRAVEERFGTGRELVLTPAADLRQAAAQLLDDFFSISYAQVFAALSVAFLGVFNAVWISIVLRRRELGLLRAVGATRGQVVGSIVLQAGLLGLVGSVAGVVGGVLVQWLVLARLLPADTGWAYPLRVPWEMPVACVVLGVLTSAAAGLLPALRAARAPLRESIGYE